MTAARLLGRTGSFVQAVTMTAAIPSARLSLTPGPALDNPVDNSTLGMQFTLSGLCASSVSSYCATVVYHGAGAAAGSSVDVSAQRSWTSSWNADAGSYYVRVRWSTRALARSR